MLVDWNPAGIITKGTSFSIEAFGQLPKILVRNKQRIREEQRIRSKRLEILLSVDIL
jgi:hypothetical protein